MKTIRFSFFKFVLFIFIFILLSLSIYLISDIFIARKNTPILIKQVSEQDSMNLKLSDFSEHQLQVLLNVEDPNFYQHKGVDIKTPGAGWTTITQALVKIYYFNRNFKPGFLRFNKIRQTLIARFVYNSKIPKKDQLKLFINEVYFGGFEGKSIYGFNEAAKIYHNKPFKKLNEDEYISLVATLVAPNKYSPNQTENADRVRRIKRLISGECQPVDFKDVFLEGCK
jgi:membrane carboxypeptidase/penicillin-binding protein